MGRRSGAGRRVKADQLEAAALGPGPVTLAENLRRVAGELWIGVGLDLHLNRQVAGGRGEQLVQRQRPLRRRLAITIEDPPRISAALR